MPIIYTRAVSWEPLAWTVHVSAEGGQVHLHIQGLRNGNAMIDAYGATIAECEQLAAELTAAVTRGRRALQNAERNAEPPQGDEPV